ncbi:Helix-turn-helix type 11 domain-containing protein OS=Lysinibacillus sphaericus OX=1421 GN=LS41612_20925 PE=4 SV=1 [Lysinibacillus sphaericus]
MPTKIAIICSKAFMKRILSIAQNIENIQLEFYLIQSAFRSTVIIKTNQTM